MLNKTSLVPAVVLLCGSRLFRSSAIAATISLLAFRSACKPLLPSVPDPLPSPHPGSTAQIIISARKRLRILFFFIRFSFVCRSFRRHRNNGFPIQLSPCNVTYFLPHCKHYFHFPALLGGIFYRKCPPAPQAAEKAVRHPHGWRTVYAFIRQPDQRWPPPKPPLQNRRRGRRGIPRQSRRHRSRRGANLRRTRRGGSRRSCRRWGGGAGRSGAVWAFSAVRRRDAGRRPSAGGDRRAGRGAGAERVCAVSGGPRRSDSSTGSPARRRGYGADTGYKRIRSSSTQITKIAIISTITLLTLAPLESTQPPL